MPLRNTKATRTSCFTKESGDGAERKKGSAEEALKILCPQASFAELMLVFGERAFRKLQFLRHV